MDSEQAPEVTPGLRQAQLQYGLPVERGYSYQVTADTWRYWELARRKRQAEVVLLLRRCSGRYLVHTKSFYPQGIYRLLSGGIKPGEDLVAAVQREASEETNLDERIERFLGILRYRFLWQGQSQPFTSYLFGLAELGGTLRTNDSSESISAYREVEMPELLALAAQLESLPADWIDWGRFRAAAHRLAVEVSST
jgi:8-oxo-dGTP pyrophosphatase MutT (NUDIX family)